MRLTYVPKKFRLATLDVIGKAEQICAEYGAQGYTLTLRQLYYQFVSRGWLPNLQSEYKRLGKVVGDARLAGALDWDYIVDRTRNLRGVRHIASPADAVSEVARGYAEDKWANQPTRVEVWIEKDALVGILDAVCPGLDVDYFSCRGYVSLSEMWVASQRIDRYLEGQNVLVLHLGDHDPSGLHMTKDITDRLQTFLSIPPGIPRRPATDKGVLIEYLLHHGITVEQLRQDEEIRKKVKAEFLTWEPPRGVAWNREWWDVRRIALEREHIDLYNPPPNPAKEQDKRYDWYVAETGLTTSWELDALPPDVLGDLIREAVAEVRDEQRWAEAEAQERERREVLAQASRRWGEVAAFLNGGPS